MTAFGFIEVLVGLGTVLLGGIVCLNSVGQVMTTRVMRSESDERLLPLWFLCMAPVHLTIVSASGSTSLMVKSVLANYVATFVDAHLDSHPLRMALYAGNAFYVGWCVIKAIRMGADRPR